MVKCRQCGFDNEAGDVFCVNCGSRLENIDIICKHCGAVVKPGEKFCGSCGTKVDIGEPPEAEEPLEPPVPDPDEEPAWQPTETPDEQPVSWFQRYKKAIIAAVIVIVAAVGAFAYMQSGNKEEGFVKSAVTISSRLSQNDEQFMGEVKKLKAADGESEQKAIIDSMKKHRQTLTTIAKDYNTLTAPDKYRTDSAAVTKLFLDQADIYDAALAIAEDPMATSAMDKMDKLQSKLDDSKNGAAAIQIPGTKFAAAGNMDALLDYLQEIMSSRKKAADAEAQAKAAQQVSYFQYANNRFAYVIDIPTSFQQNTSSPNSGYAYFVDNTTGARISVGGYNNTRKVTVATMYNNDLSHMNNANVTYTASGSNWYVIAYTRQGMANYKKVFVSSEAINQFSISFSAALSDQYKPVIDHMEPSFKPGW